MLAQQLASSTNCRGDLPAHCPDFPAPPPVVRRSSPFFAILLCTIPGIATADATATADIDSLFAQWRSRQQSSARLTCEWKESRLITKGAHSKINDDTRGPDQDTLITNEYRLLLMGDYFLRCERRGPDWDPTVGELVEREYINSFDGGAAKSFYGGNGSVVGTFPAGFIYVEQSDWDNRHLLPLLFTFRPFNDRFAPVLTHSYTLDSTPVVVGTRTCVCIRPSADVQPQYEYFVDLERECAITRCVKRFAGAISWQMDIDHTLIDGVGWSPTSWRSVLFGADGNITESAEVDDARLAASPELNESAFQFEFPADTLVTDRSGPKPRVFVHRGDGTERLVTSAERRGGIKYQRYLTTQSGEAVDHPTARGSATRTWLLLINGGAAILLIVAVVVRRRHQQSRSRTNL
jgi:hypothetical protein